MYEVLYYQADEPAYVVIDTVEGVTPEDALLRNLPALIQTVRAWYYLDSESFSDESILESLFVVRAEGMILASALHRRVTQG